MGKPIKLSGLEARFNKFRKSKLKFRQTGKDNYGDEKNGSKQNLRSKSATDVNNRKSLNVDEISTSQIRKEKGHDVNKCVLIPRSRSCVILHGGRDIYGGTAKGDPSHNVTPTGR